MPDSYTDGIGVWRCLTCLKPQPCDCAYHAQRLHSARKPSMRFFDDDHVGCYLDDIGHRVEKTKDGKEIRMVDLTLRVQPLTAELAQALDGDVRALLFNMGDALPKGKIKAIHFALVIPRQALTVRLVPEVDDAALLVPDVEITDVRARVEKGVDGYALIFYASFGPVGARDLEYVCTWHTQQRFVTFQPQEPVLDFAGAAEPAAPAGGPRRVARSKAIVPGDEIRPGVHAEH
jgi:hypothetical protein